VRFTDNKPFQLLEQIFQILSLGGALHIVFAPTLRSNDLRISGLFQLESLDIDRLLELLSKIFFWGKKIGFLYFVCMIL
jgi:hypothetical protein